MSSRSGVGFCEHPDARLAARTAARDALAGGGLQRCDLALVFGTARHDPEELLAGVREVIGAEPRLIGGATGGVITNDRLGYDGAQVGVALLQADHARFDTFSEPSLDRGEREAGRALATQIRSRDYHSEPSLLLFYDSVRRPIAEGLVLNQATPLLEGMSGVFGTWPSAAGVGMISDSRMGWGFGLFGDRVERQSALALAVSGGLRMDTAILHGCKPASGYHTITRATGSIVEEIDGRPALDLVEELVGPHLGWKEFPLFVTLGVNRGDKFGEFREDDYANRLCMAVDPERRALIMFEPDLATGADVQLMRRSIDLDYIRPQVEALLARAAGRRPVFAFYIDCIGRASGNGGGEREEAEEVQRAFGDIPLLGVYSGVEMAKVGGSMTALDWTGVLCLFSE